MKIFKFLIYILILISVKCFQKKDRNNMNKNLPKFVEIRSNIRNPDQVAADSGGGDSGEFLRRNQPQEHIFIPLINNLEAEYLIPNIKKYRKKVIEEDKGIKLKLKIDKELNIEVNKILSKK